MSKDIGTLLRETREARGISLEKAQADTKIRRLYLKALEEGEYQVIPGEAYARGFLRSYAGYLGLEGLELVRRYREERVPPPAETPALPRAVPARSSSRPVLALVGALVLVAAATYYFGVLPRQEALPDEPPPPVADAPAPPPPEPSPPPVTPPPPEPVITREDVGEEVRYRVTGDFLLVTLEFSENCWVAARVDGRLVLEQTLPAGTVRVFQATEAVAIRMGRPGTVFISINDKELGLIFQDRATNPRDIIITLLDG